MSASTPTGIYTPGSIWAKAIEQSKAEKKADSKGLDAYVYFVGAKGSGKSTLLNRFLYPNQVSRWRPQPIDLNCILFYHRKCTLVWGAWFAQNACQSLMGATTAATMSCTYHDLWNDIIWPCRKKHSPQPKLAG
eukprot:GHRR01034341.1.p1 GENE.GHRR01034341.1~~GHRR01034341.1.p1  ORF type:complete len:134 (+),score=14.93 GHRR01034341.1:184-585(+)